MNEYESLNHPKWECKYHVVFIPKYRHKVLYGSLRKHLDSLFRELARHKECEIGEGPLMVDQVHMPISIPPKCSVSQVMGYLKGQSAIPIARSYGGKRRNFVGQHFWARGYWVSTVGHNEAAVRLYIRRSKRRQTGASISWDCSKAKAALSGSKINPL
jgi:putative transposase